jgi:hypothetical protein
MLLGAIAAIFGICVVTFLLMIMRAPHLNEDGTYGPVRRGTTSLGNR